MSRETFLGLWLSLLAVMLTCRCLPLLLLRGRELPERVERALSLIPAAAFAALVANDLVKPDVYAANPTAALPVFPSARSRAGWISCSAAPCSLPIRTALRSRSFKNNNA